MKAPILSLSLAALCLLLGTLGMALGSDGFSWPEGILLSYRLCRVLAGFLGGAALAFSGSLFQNLFRNPSSSMESWQGRCFPGSSSASSPAPPATNWPG